MENKAQSNLPLFPGPRVFARYFSPSWWKHTVKFAWAFKKNLYLPVILSTVAAVMMTGTRAIYPVTSASEPVEAGPFLATMVAILVLLLVSGLLLLVTLWLGLMRLAAFCRAFLKCPVGADASTATAIQDEALTAVAQHKGSLLKAWLVASVISVPLLFALAAAGMVSMFLSPEMIALFKLGNDGALVRNGAMLAFMALFIVLSNYSMTTLASSVLLNRNLGETTRLALLLGLTSAPGLTVMTIASSLLYALICTPNAIFQSMYLKEAALMASRKPTFLDFVLDIWQGLSSLLVFPITASMLLEVLRDCLGVDTDDQKKAEKTN